MPTPIRNVRVDDDTWDTWQQVAASAGLSRSEWLRAVANEAAERATDDDG